MLTSSLRKGRKLPLNQYIYQFKEHIKSDGMCWGNICIRILSNY